MAYRTKKMINDSKVETAKRVNSVMCSCGTRIRFIWNSKVKQEYRVCPNCAKKHKNPRLVFKDTLKEMLKND